MDKVLVVDDHEQNCEILEDILSAWGYKVYKAFQGMEALDSVAKYKPDIILLDVMLPGMNGFEICKKLKKDAETTHIPIIMLTVLNEVEDRIRGFNVGADIFLSKPTNYNELRNRIESLLQNRNMLEKMESQMKIAESFMEIMKLKDPQLYRHSNRVKEYCEKVGNILGITDEKLYQLLMGAYLHDIGKVITGDNKNHVDVGLEIIRPLKLAKWINVYIRSHHEKMNGQGYPDQLKGHEMTIELQILCAVNHFVLKWEQLEEKSIALQVLETESKKGQWSQTVIEALKQVLDDEKFIENFSLAK